MLIQYVILPCLEVTCITSAIFYLLDMIPSQMQRKLGNVVFLWTQEGKIGLVQHPAHISLSIISAIFASFFAKVFL